MVNIGKWIRSILMPEIEEFKGNLKALHTEVQEGFKMVGTKIDSVEKNLNIRIDSVENRIYSVEESLGSKIVAVDRKIDLVDRLREYETRLAKLEAKS